MIETGMVDNAEVFFPYMVHHKTGGTVWELFRDTELKALPAPEEKPS